MRVFARALFLASVLALLPYSAALGQFPTYEVPPSSTLFPGPLGHPRYEEGGFFNGGFQFLHWSPPVHPMLWAARQMAVQAVIPLGGASTICVGTLNDINGLVKIDWKSLAKPKTPSPEEEEAFLRQLRVAGCDVMVHPIQRTLSRALRMNGQSSPGAFWPLGHLGLWAARQRALQLLEDSWSIPRD